MTQVDSENSIVMPTRFSDMEQYKLTAPSIPGYQPPALPVLTAEERQQLSARVKSLSEILQPARERGTELEQAIASMFGVMNVYTGEPGEAHPEGRGVVPLTQGTSDVRYREAGQMDCGRPG